MGWGYRKRCPACRHEWEGISTSARLGRWYKQVFPDFRDAFRLWNCPRCARTLTIPRSIDLDLWREWHASVAGTVAMSPYLEGLASRIDVCLSKGQPYAFVPIELDPGDCPECSEPFEEMTGDDVRLICPLCLARGDDVADGSNCHYNLFSDEYGFS